MGNLKSFVVAVAGLSVSMAVDLFTYTWTAESGSEDECKCAYLDPNIDDINTCIVAADEVGCGYIILAEIKTDHYVDMEDFESLFANSKQQVFRLPASLIPQLQFQNSKTPIVSRATVEIGAEEFELAYANDKHIFCNVTMGTYAAEDDPQDTIPVERRLEEGKPFNLTEASEENGGYYSLSLQFMTKGANYIMITNNDDNCDLAGGVTGVQRSGYNRDLSYTFTIKSTTPESPSTAPEAPSTSSATAESSIGLIVAVCAVVLAAVALM